MPVVATRYWVSGKGDGVAGWRLYLYCPGCDDLHDVEIAPENNPHWEWNGDRDRPTIVPSILRTGVQWPEGEHFHKPRHHVAAGEPIFCHSFVTDGNWVFLSDCTHDLAGQTLPLPELPREAVE